MRLFEHPVGAMLLERYPPGAANDTLQAWDAEDDYLLQACPPAQQIIGSTLILNDALRRSGLRAAKARAVLRQRFVPEPACHSS